MYHLQVYHARGRGGEAGVGGFRVGDRQCVSEVRWSHSINSTVLAIMWWLVSSCNISLEKNKDLT